jgi:hypothetical protein
MLDFALVERLTSKSWLKLGSLATAAVFVLLLCLFFEPRWETNDDVGMSMVAHGYGVAAIGSPNLIFSNVLWGYLVRVIPEINGVLGYSIATLSVLVIVGTVVIYGLFRLGVGYVACLSALALILVRPVLFPQFTINAGLLLMGAIICWHLYAQQNDWRALLTGCILAFLSYLVRSQECLLVFIVALPLFPWRTLLLRRSAKVALLAFVSAIIFSTFIDHQAYQGDSWKVFNELNPVRARFTDYGAGGHLIRRTDILERHGYSTNDVNLVVSWFFVDTQIAHPVKLQSMLTELGPLPAQTGALANGWVGVQTLWHPMLLPLVMAAMLLALLLPNWKVATSWALCIAAVFVMGLMGRPGILRVYVPLVSLLVIAPFLATNATNWRKHLGVCVLLAACLFNASLVFSESNTSQITVDHTRKGLVDFPNEPVVVWADTFPFESVYPVLGASSAAMHYRLYCLGCYTHAPFSVSYNESQDGRGMIDRLMSEKGVPVLAWDVCFNLLKIYCREHLQGELKVLSAHQYGDWQVIRCRCEVKN